MSSIAGFSNVEFCCKGIFSLWDFFYHFYSHNFCTIFFGTTSIANNKQFTHAATKKLMKFEEAEILCKDLLSFVKFFFLRIDSDD